MERIRRGETGIALRRQLALEVTRKPGRIFPGTKPTGERIGEREFVIASPSRLFEQRREFFPTLGFDPLGERFVFVKKLTPRRPKEFPRRSIFEKPKKQKKKEEKLKKESLKSEFKAPKELIKSKFERPGLREFKPPRRELIKFPRRDQTVSC